ncbi:hypothetical protein [Pseudonocardia acidicola]|uniref:Uncharacterized protein n=1 Tax=Pseudonocardia acidicola TaxID=2724939 RepID=A0ABX1S764_9PSEU|nr:hypothetical protein [Pseudonocardia acidicola]NMH96211.1 hypothetical protein [Pseudonocardia acidicola]
MKLALMLGGMAAGRRNGGPAELLAQGTKLLERSPELQRLADEVRGRLLDAGKGAAMAVAARQVEALTDRVGKRVESLGDVGAPGPKGRRRRDDEDREPAGETEESDEVEGGFDEDVDRSDADEDTGDLEEHEDEREEDEEPARATRRRSAADRAGSDEPDREPPASRRREAASPPSRAARSGAPKDGRKRTAAKADAVGSRVSAAAGTAARTGRSARGRRGEGDD